MSSEQYSWTEKLGRLQFMGSQIVRHDWVTKLTHTHTCTLIHTELLYYSLSPKYKLLKKHRCWMNEFPKRKKQSGRRYSVMHARNSLFNRTIISDKLFCFQIKVVLIFLILFTIPFTLIPFFTSELLSRKDFTPHRSQSSVSRHS